MMINKQFQIDFVNHSMQVVLRNRRYQWRCYEVVPLEKVRVEETTTGIRAWVPLHIPLVGILSSELTVEVNEFGIDKWKLTRKPTYLELYFEKKRLRESL